MVGGSDGSTNQGVEIERESWSVDDVKATNLIENKKEN